MKIMFCNIGWSDEYTGALLKGAHEFIRKLKGDGSERWNFKQYKDGLVRGYIRGIGLQHSPPQLKEHQRYNWTIIFYAKDPYTSRLKVVGYYRDASILPNWRHRPEGTRILGKVRMGSGLDFDICAL